MCRDEGIEVRIYEVCGGRQLLAMVLPSARHSQARHGSVKRTLRSVDKRFRMIAGGHGAFGAGLGGIVW